MITLEKFSDLDEMALDAIIEEYNKIVKKLDKFLKTDANEVAGEENTEIFLNITAEAFEHLKTPPNEFYLEFKKRTNLNEENSSEISAFIAAILIVRDKYPDFFEFVERIHNETQNE